MVNKIDYEKIDFISLLEYYNIKNIHPRSDEITFSCPFPEHKRGDRNPSANINTESGLFHCFSCGRKGTLVNFVAEVEEISIKEAEKKLRRAYDRGIGENRLHVYPMQYSVKNVKKTLLSENHLSLFNVDWDLAWEAYRENALPKPLRYPFHRGLGVDILKDFNVGYDKISNRITIPYRDFDGTLVGFKARTPDPEEEPRYISLGDKRTSKYGFPTFKSVNYIFGLHSATKNKQSAIIVEGEFDVLSMRQRGFDTTIGISGSNPTINQARLINKNFDSVIMLLDPDKAGRRATQNLINKLVSLRRGMVIDIAWLVNGDPDESSTEEIKQAILDSQRIYPFALL